MHAEVIINVTAEKSFETYAQDNYDFYILHVLLNSQIHFPSSGGGGGCMPTWTPNHDSDLDLVWAQIPGCKGFASLKY